MATTLTYSATSLTLSDDLLWVDEAAWQPVAQTSRRTLTGALLLEAGARQGGRPITLAGGDRHGWISRTALEQLLVWLQIAGAQFTLVHRGATRTVAFDHERGGLEARPVIDFNTPAAGDWYVATLRFIEL